jgi:hypothetical protein
VLTGTDCGDTTAREGRGFVPPPATGFCADVPIDDPFAPRIEALFNRGIIGGCTATPFMFCPDAAVTRAQLALLLPRALAVAGFALPEAATGVFADVPAGDPFAQWIGELFRRGLTDGCQAVPPAFCPEGRATQT